MSTKKAIAMYLADFSIGPKLGDNPLRQKIEQLLEEKRLKLKEEEAELSKIKGIISKTEDRSEISELEELILDSERTVELYQVHIEKLEGALRGEPLYTEGYLRFKKDTAKMFKRWDLRKKYGLS